MTTKQVVLAILFFVAPVSAHANRVWAEYGLATATAGYDAKSDRTLISKYYRGAVGPDSVPNLIRDFIISCAKSSTAVGALAFRSTPGEISAKTTAATVAFQGAFTSCVTGRGAAKFLAGQFYISFDRHMYWESGLNLKFSAENVAAQNYEIIQRVIGVHVPDPLNRAIVLWYGLQQPPNIDIKLQLPEGARGFLKLAPTAPQMNQYAQTAQIDAVNQSLHLVSSALSEPKNLPQTLGSTAASILQGQAAAQIQIYTQMTQQIADSVNLGLKTVNDVSARTTVASIPMPANLPPIKLSPIPSIPTTPQGVVTKILCPFCN